LKVKSRKLTVWLEKKCKNAFISEKTIINNDPLFMNSDSNHPPSIINQIPLSVNKPISQLSSDQSAFSAAAPLYKNASNHSNYHANLHYTPRNNGIMAINEDNET
jgi:hypothetical protein